MKKIWSRYSLFALTCYKKSLWWYGFHEFILGNYYETDQWICGIMKTTRYEFESKTEKEKIQNKVSGIF